MHCGASNPPLAKFCPNCGSSVDGSVKANPPTIQPKSRIRLASELKNRGNSLDDDNDSVYDGPAEVPKIEKLEIEISVDGKMDGESYSSKRFKNISDLLENK